MTWAVVGFMTWNIAWDMMSHVTWHEIEWTMAWTMICNVVWDVWEYGMGCDVACNMMSNMAWNMV